MVKKLQALRAKKGFTLVELIVVIAIIGVLAAILIPTISGVLSDSKKSSVESTCQSIQTQAKAFCQLSVTQNSTKAEADSTVKDESGASVNLAKYIASGIPEITASGSNKGAVIIIVAGEVKSVMYKEGDFWTTWDGSTGKYDTKTSTPDNSITSAKIIVKNADGSKTSSYPGT